MQTILYKPRVVGCSLMYKASDIPISAKCELVLRTHFPDPPYVDLDRRNWKQANRSMVIYEIPDLGLAQNDNARLTHAVLLSTLAAVLLLRNSHRIRRLANTMIRGSALGNNRTINHGQRSYHVVDASDTIAVSQISTGSERAPAETLCRRFLKKPPIIHRDERAVKARIEAGIVKNVDSTRLEDGYYYRNSRLHITSISLDPRYFR